MASGLTEVVGLPLALLDATRAATRLLGRADEIENALASGGRHATETLDEILDELAPVREELNGIRDVAISLEAELKASREAFGGAGGSDCRTRDDRGAPRRIPRARVRQGPGHVGLGRARVAKGSPRRPDRRRTDGTRTNPGLELKGGRGPRGRRGIDQRVDAADDLTNKS